MNDAIDLTACEHEPITIPGSIQPHGLLLVLRGTGLTVVQASANLPLFLNAAPGEMLGQPVGQWFDEASARALGEAAQSDDPGRANPLLLTARAARTSVLTGSFIAADPTSSWNWSVRNRRGPQLRSRSVPEAPERFDRGGDLLDCGEGSTPFVRL